MNSRSNILFITKMLLATGFAVFIQGCKSENVDKQEVTTSRPNILLIVVDDFNYDSAGFTGGVAPNVTPNLDRLAAESYSFEKAFTTVSVCQPARQSMLSGLIPNHYGSGGFFPIKTNNHFLWS